MTMLRTVGITLAIFFASAHARADEISDEQAACQGGEVGKACTVRGIPGTCESSKCSRIDYSGDKPKSVDRECVVCKPSGAAKAEAPTKQEPATPEPVPAKTAEPAQADAPAKADVPAKAEPAKSEPAKAEPAKAETAPAKSSCAVEPGPLSLGTIPLGLVLVAFARRRR